MRRLIYLLLITVAVACGGAAAPGAATPEVSAPPSVASTPLTASTRPVVATVPPAPASRAKTPLSAGPAPAGSEPAPGATPAETPAYAGPVVSVGGAGFPVDLAITPAERAQGLSDRPYMDPGTGMLFIFEDERSRAFWMKDMHFPLDMVWIDGRCAVADITRNARPPEPGQALSDLPMYSPDKPARYVLEINAGEADSTGIEPGDRVAFAGSLTGLYGC